MDVNLKILEIKKFNEYILQSNENKKKYSLILEFYGLDKPKVNDTLVLNENLLNTKHKDYSQPYAFEILNDNDLDVKENDMAGLVTKDKKYILKRIYG